MDVLKDNRPKIEITLLSCVILLIGIGYGFLYSASEPSAVKYFNNQYYYLIRQGIYIFIGVIFFVFGLFIDHTLYTKYIKYIVLFTIILLIMTVIPGIGKEVGGARRWISVSKFQFQPSEIAKLTVVFYLSSVLANKKILSKIFIREFYLLLFWQDS